LSLAQFLRRGGQTDSHILFRTCCVSGDDGPIWARFLRLRWRGRRWRWLLATKGEVEAGRIPDIALAIVIERAEILKPGQEIFNLDRPKADMLAEFDIKPAAGRHAKG